MIDRLTRRFGAWLMARDEHAAEECRVQRAAAALR